MTDKTTRIEVAGRLAEHFSAGLGFDADEVTQIDDGPNTVLQGHNLDERQIHGLLAYLQDLGIKIVSLSTTDR